MADNFGEPLNADFEGEKKNRTWVIILVVVLVLCCCCVVAGAGGWWLWENGDRLMDDLGLVLTLTYFLV